MRTISPISTRAIPGRNKPGSLLHVLNPAETVAFDKGEFISPSVVWVPDVENTLVSPLTQINDVQFVVFVVVYRQIVQTVFATIAVVSLGVTFCINLSVRPSHSLDGPRSGSTSKIIYNGVHTQCDGHLYLEPGGAVDWLHGTIIYRVRRALARSTRSLIGSIRSGSPP